MIRLIIPAFNEEKNIAKCIQEINHVLTRAKLKSKIYIVDDGSTDSTPKILETIRKTIPLIILRHQKNKGVAQAFRTGIEKVLKESRTNDYIVIMEADQTSDERLLPKIISTLKHGSDIVICSRYQKGGGYKNFPLRRTVLSILANQVLRLTFPIKGVKDYTIFYRGYKTWILQKLLKKYRNNFIKTTFYVANSEILIKMAKFSPHITEIPFLYNYGKKKKPSAMKIFRNVRAYLKFILENL